jgi:hypothetical protein
MIAFLRVVRMKSPRDLLRADEISIISRCLRAAEEGPFFPEWEFQTLFGVNREDIRNVRLRWPNVSLKEEMVRVSVFNSLTLLLAYPHGDEKELQRYVPEGRSGIREVLDRLSTLELP